ncbi:MAG: DUF2087 domain-containing protein [Cellulosilyticum sp.]|nr:DUF2087 domain-containing protein [Cellulosilyticum sp.]
MDIETGLFEDYAIDEIKQGYTQDEKGYNCLICGERFEKGQIYSFSGKLYEGRKAIKLHIQYKHDSVKEVLLSMNANRMGISELQLQLLNFFAQGLSDKEIAAKLEVSTSTIRNHRHKLREREKQNKIFVSLMELLQQDGLGGRASLQHDKFKEDEQGRGISNQERKRILEQYMTPSGRLLDYPRHNPSKCVILEAILVNFVAGRKYLEKEIDDILRTIYEDYKLLKRELITYNYLDRTHTGAVYWVKEYNSPDYLEAIAR